MPKTIAYLFAGQGSQYIGMGKDLYAAFPESKAVFDKADKVLRFPLTKLLFEGPQQELTQTANCQPAILTMSIACWQAFKVVTSGQLPVASYAAGLSLGEYSALVAAEALSFEDAVYLVRRRGEFMEQEARRIPGKMLSIIGLDLACVKQISAETNTEIANINCPGQIVISGSAQGIEKAKKQAEELGAKMALFLEVSGAFHSSFMKEAGLKLARELERIKINTPCIPVICNVSAKPASSTAEIKENLIKQVACGVLWEDSMKFILSKGVINFIEFGPGKVLKGLLRRIDANVQVVTIEKRDDILALQ
jgi:[acyl-carrier-protein] S-malonyltransferase